MLEGENKLLYLLGCPGDVVFRVYNKIKDGWKPIYCTENSSYGYDPKHDYEWTKEDHGMGILTKSTHDSITSSIIGDYNANRKPTHTGYDCYMIYWTLEGKRCVDYTNRAWRVRIISEDNEKIEKFINGIFFLDKWGVLCV